MLSVLKMNFEEGKMEMGGGEGTNGCGEEEEVGGGVL